MTELAAATASPTSNASPSRWARLPGPAGIPRGGKRVLLAALALIVVQLVVRGLVAGHGYFYWDDLVLTSRGGRYPLFSGELLLHGHDGHFMPGAFFLGGLATRLAPLQWAVPAVMLVVLQALASLSVLRLLRLLLGARPALLVPLLLYLFSPLTLPAFAWWAAALNALPLQIALAWVAGDALLLARTGRTRYAVTGSIGFVFGLAFFEKALVIPFVCFATVALAARVAGARRPIRTTLRRGRRLWVPLVLIALAWGGGYLAFVSPMDGHGSAGSAVRLLTRSVTHGFAPAIFGGPWSWDRWPPSPPWAVPSDWAVAASLVGLGVVVAISVARRRRTVAIWICAAAYVIGAQLPIYLLRSGPNTATELAQTLRYLPDAAVVLAIAVALLLRAPRRAVRSAPSAVRRPARRVVAAVLALAFVASSLWTTHTFTRSWENNPTTAYLHNAQAALAAGTSVPLLDQPISIWVLLPVAYPENRAANVFGPLTDRPPFADSTPELRRIDDSGRIVPAQVDWTRSIGGGPAPGCGYRIPAGRRTVIPLSGPLLHWEWTAQLNYFASRDGEVDVALTAGANVRVPVRAGLHTVYVRLVGVGPTLVLRPLTPGLELCLGAGPIGQVIPR